MFFSRSKPMTLPEPADALPDRSHVIEVASTHQVLGTPMKGPWPDMAIAYFALGCFWGAERKFWQTEGVVCTAARACRGRWAARFSSRSESLPIIR